MDDNVRARLRAGEAAAFELVFDEYSHSVYNHAFRLTGNWSTAEDVVAVTFLEAWRLRTRVEPEGGSLRPWLLGIAMNVARNTSRSARRYESAVARLREHEVVPDFADELVGRIDDTERLRLVRAAIAGLRRADREVIELCVWGGLDYATAAEVLGVPVGTVRSRLARARRKLAAARVDIDAEGNPDLGPGQERVGRTTATRSEQEENR